MPAAVSAPPPFHLTSIAVANADFELLLNVLIPAAQHLLSRHGEFFPIGASVTAGGEIKLHDAAMDEEQPLSSAVIDHLMDAYRNSAGTGTWRAVSLCYDVRVPVNGQPSDALCLDFWHGSGEGMRLYLPYREGWFGRYRYGKLFGGLLAAEEFWQGRPPR